MFSPTITQLTTTNTNHANNFNAINNVLIANDNFLKSQADDSANKIDVLEETHHVKTIFGLSSIGLTDAQMSETDFDTNIAAICTALPIYTEITIYLGHIGSSELRLTRSFIARLLADTGIDISSYPVCWLTIGKFNNLNHPYKLDVITEPVNSREKRFFMNINRDADVWSIPKFREVATVDETRIYSKLEHFGRNEKFLTVEQIVLAMRSSSVGIFMASELIQDVAVLPYPSGTLIIHKYENWRASLQYVESRTSSAESRMYFSHFRQESIPQMSWMLVSTATSIESIETQISDLEVKIIQLGGA